MFLPCILKNVPGIGGNVTEEPRQEIHYNAKVWVNPVTDPMRRAESLCYNCKNFKAGEPDECPIARKLYDVCVEESVSLAVTRCPVFEASSENYNSEPDNEVRMVGTPNLEIHYGTPVWVSPTLESIRRKECLCFNCNNMQPGENNCPIAQKLYTICVVENTALAVTRCPVFEKKE